MNTHTIVAYMHQNVLQIHEDIGNQNQGVSDLGAIWHHGMNVDPGRSDSHQQNRRSAVVLGRALDSS